MNSQMLENLFCGGNLTSASVHKYQVRHSSKTALALQCTPESSFQHFRQAAVVVLPLNGSYLEPPVILFNRLKIAKYHHSPHRVHSVCVGNVIGFHPIGFLFFTQNPGKGLSQSLFLFRGRGNLKVNGLGKLHHIPSGKLKESPLVTFLRNGYLHLAAVSLSLQKFLQQGLFTKRLRHYDFAGHNRPAAVILLYELAHEAVVVVLSLCLHGESFPARQLAAANCKKNHDSVFAASCRQNHIHIMPAYDSNPLSLTQSLGRSDIVTVNSRFLVVHLAGSLLHL